MSSNKSLKKRIAAVVAGSLATLGSGASDGVQESKSDSDINSASSDSKVTIGKKKPMLMIKPNFQNPEGSKEYMHTSHRSHSSHSSHSSHRSHYSGSYAV